MNLNKKILFDLMQLVCALIIAAGVWGGWGWPLALIVFGALVLVLGFVDAMLISRASR